MILFLILLVILVAALVVYAAQNGNTENVSFLTFQLSSVPAWQPPVIAGGAMALLLLLYMLYANARHGFRRRSLTRKISEHEASLAELRSENESLRRDLHEAAARLEGRGPVAPGDSRP